MKAGTKRDRLIDLLIVLLMVFVPSILSSTYTLLTGDVLYNKEIKSEHFLWSVISNISSVIFLIYILARQRRTLCDIGLSFSLWDIPISALLFGAQLLCRQAAYFVTNYLHCVFSGDSLDFSAANVDFLQAGITVWYILNTITNPIFEELLVRGYVMTETKYIWGRTSLAIAASVTVQLLYHTYQGLWPLLGHAVVFLLSAAYYAKWKRITPVILAHLYSNLYSMLYQASQV